MRENYDVIVVGAGPAGSSAALAMAEAGFNTALVDRIDPLATSQDDLRTTALLEPSIDFLLRLGVWPKLEQLATPLETLRIVDAGMDRIGALQRDFVARETGSETFGWNIANADLKRILGERIVWEERLALFANTQILHVMRRADIALMTLETPEGRMQLASPLIVAADGRRSQIRSDAGVAVRRLNTGHYSTVFVVRHPEPHGNVSIEIYDEGGPFTLVPFQNDADGTPRSSVVWMTRAADAIRLQSLDDAAFSEAATARSRATFGPLEVASKRMSWQVESLMAEKMTARRLALLGEAAHAAPPIGAQGLNMSLADAEALVQAAQETHSEGRELGDEKMLSAYARLRERDVAARVAGIAALNIAADGGAAAVRAARRLGLAAAHDLKPLRDLLMREGLGGSVSRVGPI